MARISPTQIKASRLLAPVLAISILAGCAGLRRDAEASVAAPAKADDARIRLAVLNAGFLPGPLGSRNVERAERIADRLLVEPGPDVIVLLEVFDERARRALVRRFAPSHPWIVARADAGLVLREDSGLFVASRIPFVSKRRPAFRSFRARGPLTFADHWTAKGVLGAELDLGADRSLCLFATHLQADRRRPGENATVRARQLTEVRQFATGFMRGVAPERRSAALLVGDLNVEGETAGGTRPTREYRTLRARLGEARDLFREANPTAPGFTWNVDASAPGADPRQAPQRLDYAFAWRALASGASLTNLRTRTVDLDPGLSDHRGLAVELALAARPSTSVVPDLFVTDSIAALSYAR